MEKSILLNGIDLHYEECGEGLPVIFLHGWGCDHSIFKTASEQLSSSFHIYSIDFPGFGASTEPPVVWGVEEYTQLFRDFVEKLAIENPSIIAHSFGGRIAILYASRFPVRRLVLVDAAGIKPRRKLRYYIKVYAFKLAKVWMRTVYSPEEYARRLESRRLSRASSDYIQASPVMRGVLSKVVNTDLRKYLPLIKASTLLFWGEKDTATPIRDAKIMDRLIPDSGLVSFPEAGHFSFIDRPFDFRVVIAHFLAQSDK